ncbi:MAG: amino acid permease [Lewinellaceae bacterium]|nr:amino acid permease [Saprospiraceae bacterium]MCB9342174.1 amino acid permease [Lewinellaceae bacterium]
MAFLNNLFRKKSIDDAISSARQEDIHGTGGLDKNLSVRDLTALGIAAIIGAGIFSTIGSASFNGGPAVVFLFIFTAMACGFAAFAYAEFASMLPVSGSAYTYSYVAFGELIAWIIGWALVMEYAVGNITVAVSWSSYFTSLCDSSGWHIPAWATTDYVSAKDGYNSAMALLKGGTAASELTDATVENMEAWKSAPMLGGLRIILDIPAIIMSILITALVYIGMKESKTAGNIMVVLKLLVVLLVIIVGAGYVNTENWHPFAPNGFGGVMAGVSSVFFAYIGFDALSTTAEECKNPQRDLPRAMLYAIIICTVLYIIIALVLTGMVNYQELNVNDPLAYVFEKINLRWFSGIIAVSAIVAMAGVFLVFQLGQPRIWMTMSRDGLLPKRFSYIHPKYKTPSFATIITGLFVVVPMLFIPSDTVLDLCSMGTLFAFVLVCGGVLKLQISGDAPKGKFKTPYVNAKYVYPALLLAAGVFLFTKMGDDTKAWLTNEKEMFGVEDLLHKIPESEIPAVQNFIAQRDSAGFANAGSVLTTYLDGLENDNYKQLVTQLPVSESLKYNSGWSLFQHKIPMWLFTITCLILVIPAFRHNLSLIPILGLVSCFYMMAQIPAHSWMGFFIWLVAGLMIYFGYGYANSKLTNAK